MEGQETEFELWELLLWLMSEGVFLYAGTLMLAGTIQFSAESESEE